MAEAFGVAGQIYVTARGEWRQHVDKESVRTGIPMTLTSIRYYFIQGLQAGIDQKSVLKQVSPEFTVMSGLVAISSG